MKASRTITIAVATGALLAATAAGTATAASAATVLTAPTTTPTMTEQSAPTPWGPRYAPGKRAVAKGTLTSSQLNKQTIPNISTVKVKGKVTDLTRGGGCGWAVFRVTYLKSDGSVPFKHRSYLDCSYGTPKPFSFTDRNVALVELKVCNERRAGKPSDICLYAGTWKTLHSNL
ncbi:hypothetical protein [Nonomuraea cavernae]|uniref:Secreted protein n=1 Tax=Nonomuraea cavernae TaxID=2045107 RepID=A0A917YRB1_9ACTN|nr:hypothetical protein [Nonomuraea cavernae]MCA2183654.1 hypothetical protein [Nonomuraea cavernae]GGO60952.1 hypothetical protein GCM10012289_02030 [Nonomuraea cavernae]